MKRKYTNEELKQIKKQKDKVRYENNKEKYKERYEKYYEENKEKINAKKREYRKQNSEKIINYRKQHYNQEEIKAKTKKRKANYLKTPNGKFNNIKDSAKHRDIEFQLTLEEYKKNFYMKKCYYCDKEDTVGIDRIDNSKGYIENNMKPCCEQCNKMKLNYSEKEFIEKCEIILKIYNQRKSDR